MANYEFISVPLAADEKAQIQRMAKERDCTMAEILRSGLEKIGVSSQLGKRGRPPKKANKKE